MTVSVVYDESTITSAWGATTEDSASETVGYTAVSWDREIASSTVSVPSEA